MTEPNKANAARAIYARLGELPDWLIVVLFVVLAVILAIAGQLDDWLRGALAVTFSLLAIAFAGRIAAHHHREQP